MVEGGVGTGYQQFLKERHNASMTNDELIATYKNQLLQGTPPKLRDIFWGNMNELNYYISAYIADLVMEHYADTETTDLPKEDESVLAPIMTGRAVELEQMIYSFVEMLTDKDEDTVEAVNVSYSSTLLKFFGIAEAVIQYGDTDVALVSQQRRLLRLTSMP